MKLRESELIINPDGSIYHLKLRPEQIADTILTVGDPGRVGRVSRHFDTIEHKLEKREFHTHTGTLNGRRLTVLSTGIGPDNIDIVLNELDALVNIDLETREVRKEHRQLRIIRVGTCGCLQPDIPVDAFVSSAYGLGLDNLFDFYEYHPNLGEAELFDELQDFLLHAGALPVRPYFFEGAPDLRRRLSANMHTGITLTCPGFYGPQGRQLRLRSRLQLDLIETMSNFESHGLKLLNFEMETSAIFGLARLLGHQAASCNVVLANRRDRTFSPNPQAAIDRLIEEVLERLMD